MWVQFKAASPPKLELRITDKSLIISQIYNNHTNRVVPNLQEILHLYIIYLNDNNMLSQNQPKEIYQIIQTPLMSAFMEDVHLNVLQEVNIKKSWPLG